MLGLFSYRFGINTQIDQPYLFLRYPASPVTNQQAAGWVKRIAYYNYRGFFSPLAPNIFFNLKATLIPESHWVFSYLAKFCIYEGLIDLYAFRRGKFLNMFPYLGGPRSPHRKRVLAKLNNDKVLSPRGILYKHPEMLLCIDKGKNLLAIHTSKLQKTSYKLRLDKRILLEISIFLVFGSAPALILSTLPVIGLKVSGYPKAANVYFGHKNRQEREQIVF